MYGLEACPLNKANISPLDFVVDIKLFKTIYTSCLSQRAVKSCASNCLFEGVYLTIKNSVITNTDNEWHWHYNIKFKMA